MTTTQLTTEHFEMITIASPMKVATVRSVIDKKRVSVYLGANIIGFVTRTANGWFAEDTSDRKMGTHKTKTEAVRYLIDHVAIIDAKSRMWCFYGESWEDHCKRLYKGA